MEKLNLQKEFQHLNQQHVQNKQQVTQLENILQVCQESAKKLKNGIQTKSCDILKTFKKTNIFNEYRRGVKITDAVTEVMRFRLRIRNANRKLKEGHQI